MAARYKLRTVDSHKMDSADTVRCLETFEAPHFVAGRDVAGLPVRIDALMKHPWNSLPVAELFVVAAERTALVVVVVAAAAAAAAAVVAANH